MFFDVLMSGGIVVFGVFIFLLVQQFRYVFKLMKYDVRYVSLFAGLLFIMGKWLFNSLNGLACSVCLYRLHPNYLSLYDECRQACQATMNTILITGGLGFIGSHTVVECLTAKKKVIILDDCSNSSEDVLDRIEQITSIRPLFVKGSILDESILTQIFSNHTVDGVIHFAAFKAVNESVNEPLKYFHNNVTGTLTLLKVMEAHRCKETGL
jgi:hypothetical protein